MSEKKPHFTLPPELDGLPRQPTPEPANRGAPQPLEETVDPSVSPSMAPTLENYPVPKPEDFPDDEPEELTEDAPTPRDEDRMPTVEGMPVPPPEVSSVKPKSVPPPASRETAAKPPAPEPEGSNLPMVGGALVVLALVGAGAIWFAMQPTEQAPRPEPEPEPVVAAAAPAPVPAPKVEVEPAEPEPEPEPPPPPAVLEWDALGPKIEASYGKHLGLWFERGAEPAAQADKPAVIGFYRTTGYAKQDLTLHTPDGDHQTELNGKAMPERELAGDVVEVPTDSGRVHVFNPIYAPAELTVVERWTLDGTVILNKEHTVAASFCYGLRSTTKLPDDTPAGATLVLALLPAEGDAPLAERTWTIQRKE